MIRFITHAGRIPSRQTPIFNFMPAANAFVLEGHYLPYMPDWRPYPNTNQVYVPTDIDTHLGEVREILPSCIAEMNARHDEEGSLIVVSSWIEPEIPQMGHYMRFRQMPILLLGLVYLDAPLRPDEAVPLNREHPCAVIEQICHGDFSFFDRQRRAYTLRQSASERYHKQDQERANDRARKLLLSCLNPNQRLEFEACNMFHVRTRRGETFRIIAKPQHNVFRLEPMHRDDEPLLRKAVMEYCLVHQDSRIPVYDLMLAQKLLLETDPEKFVSLANKWELDDGNRRRADVA